MGQHSSQDHRNGLCKLHDLKQIEFLDTTGHLVDTVYRYGWLFDPPRPELAASPSAAIVASVDWSRLILEWILIGVVTAGGLAMSHRRAAK